MANNADDRLDAAAPRTTPAPTNSVRRRKSEAERRIELVDAAFSVACREGIEGVTVRAVAAEAGVSHGLVLFHFGRKEELVVALLDWLIEHMAVLRVSEDIARFPDPIDRLYALVQQEITRVATHPGHTRLFREFWILGTRDEGVRARIQAEVRRYRAAFLGIVEEVLQSDPALQSGTTAAGFSAVAVSWIEGCAVQALIEPDTFDADEYMAAMRTVIHALRGDGRGLAGARDPA